MSMEEEQARQAAAAGQSTSTAPASAEAAEATPTHASQEQDVNMEGSAPAASEAVVDDEDLSEEEAIARAIEMSMQDKKEDPSKKS